MIIDEYASDGEVIWVPNPDDLTGSEVTRFIEFLAERGFQIDGEYEDLWQWTVDHPEDFWQQFATFADVELVGEGSSIRTEDPMPHTRWFTGQTLNFARHLLADRDGTALLSVSEDNSLSELSWKELREQTASFAEYLRESGVKKGDRVVAVLPNVAEAVVALLATASVGAIWSICAPEFGPGAIISRFAQLEPKVLIAAPGYQLGGKERDRTAELTEIIDALPTVEKVVWVTKHSPASVPPPVPMRSDRWEDTISLPSELRFVDIEFNEPLWVLFSSGTTGVPKGIVHSHGGALLEILKMLIFHSDLKTGDRYLNVASTSWVLWNSLVGALGVGATPVLMDGNPTFPSADRVWQVAALTNTAVLGVGAGFIHACAKADLHPRGDHNLSHLRAVQVTGSPLSNDGFRWVYQAVGDVWLASMCGGTDIASIFVGGSPTLPVRVGYIQAPALGVRVESWDNSGNPTIEKGELVVTDPMPSMPLYFWGDDDGSRYHASYFEDFPGVWKHGDFIEFGLKGIIIHGRSDSTLNRHGLRLGSADIYAVVEAIPGVAEALVIGAELSAEDYYMPLFVQLTDGADAADTEVEIVNAIRANLSVRYLPDDIIIMRAIPHTRTGKKLEIPVKRLIQGADLAEVVDLGAVDDSELMSEYAAFAASVKRSV